LKLAKIYKYATVKIIYDYPKLRLADMYGFKHFGLNNYKLFANEVE
jgi:hypothetical protein